jgi:hypothetical protein
MRGTLPRRIAGTFILGIVLFFPHLASAQEGIATGSLTVTGYGQASGPADLATVYLTISSASAMMGPPAPASAEDREAMDPVVDALVAAGIDETSIEVITGPSVMSASWYGPATAIIRFDLTDPTAETMSAAIEAATDAAADGRLFIGGMSVHLRSDDCAALERDAREAAVTDARARAEVMGELTDLLPGETLSVRDISFTPESGFVYVNPVLSGCSPVAPDTFLPDMFGPIPYDMTQEPTVTVYAQVEMTFAASPSILATPSG